MKNNWLKLVLVLALVIMSVSIVGCSKENTDEPKENTTQEQPKTETKDVEKQKLAIKAKTIIAEEKLTFIFDPYTPEGSDQEYSVAKENYKTIDDLKKYLSAYFTEGMSNTIIENYIKVQDVPGKGEVPTLTLPEDYMAYSSEAQPEITVDGDTATLTSAQDGKTLTYTYVYQNNTWLIDTKTVQ